MTTPIVADPLVRLARAAAELNVSSWTLRNWCKSGRLRYLRISSLIMIPTSEIKRLVRESYTSPKESE